MYGSIESKNTMIQWCIDIVPLQAMYVVVSLSTDLAGDTGILTDPGIAEQRL